MPSYRGVEWISDIAGFEVYSELETADRPAFLSGQFYWAPVRYPMAPPAKVLTITRHDPSDEAKTEFRITSFSRHDTSQSIPLKTLGLPSDARLFMVTGKERPVIILGYCETEWKRLEKLALCLPVFSFKTRHTQNCIVRIQTCDFPSFFYLQPSITGLPNESAARFELIQPIQKGDLQPMKNGRDKYFKLSDYTLKLLHNHLSIFINSEPLNQKLQAEITAYKELVSQEFAEAQ